jgi:hypothetical protein
VIKREAEKILQYKDLTIEIQHMWNVTAEVIPVIIGATGTISKSLTQYLSNVPGKREIKELQKSLTQYLSNVPGKREIKKLQKTDTLCTAHILREMLI